MAQSLFIINVQDIQEEGLHVAFDDISVCRGFDPDLPEDIRLSGPIACSADLFRQGRHVHLSGKIKGVLVLKCHRCLEDCTVKIDRDFYYMLQARADDETEGLREVSLGADDLDVCNFVNGEIRLDEIFREQLLLQVPIKALCSEGCRGICPGCGRNLNEEECCCEAGNDHSPFAILRGLKSG